MDAFPKIGEILVDAGLIDKPQLRIALGEQQRWGGRLGSTLVKLGFVEERDLVRALASQLALPIAKLEGKKIEDSVLAVVPADFAETNMCLPLFLKEDDGTRTLFLGMEDPCDLRTLDDLSFRTGMIVKPVMVGPSELAEAIDRCYCLGSTRPRVQPDAPAYARPIEIPLSEPILSDTSELEGGSATPTPAPAEAISTLAPSPESRAESWELESDPSTETVLSALTQLLVEKGLIELQELLDKVRQGKLESSD
jgi:type IV pilus assembly protein PilB